MPSVPKEIVDEATNEFPLYLKRVRTRWGGRVVVVGPPYHEGLATVRACIRIKGVTKRVFFYQGKWRRS
jgi:hypothetical protein